MGKIINYDFENKKVVSESEYKSKDYKEGYDKGVIDARVDIYTYITSKLKIGVSQKQILFDILKFMGSNEKSIEILLNKGENNEL